MRTIKDDDNDNTYEQAGLRPDCKLGPREQFNEISSFLDGGTIYSNQPGLLHELRYWGYSCFLFCFCWKILCCDDNDDVFITCIRLNKGGLMKTLPVFENQNLRDLMPLKVCYKSFPC